MVKGKNTVIIYDFESWLQLVSEVVCVGSQCLHFNNREKRRDIIEGVEEAELEEEWVGSVSVNDLNLRLCSDSINDPHNQYHTFLLFDTFNFNQSINQNLLFSFTFPFISFRSFSLLLREKEDLDFKRESWISLSHSLLWGHLQQLVTFLFSFSALLLFLLLLLSCLV